MAHELDIDELAAQRAQGQWSKIYLAIPEYHTIYTARLNGVPTLNDMVAQISVDTESGTSADVLADMTLYVGTAAGGYDLGMCRIRKTPIAGTIYVSETSDIVWQDNAYLTVIDDYSLWQKSLRIVSDAPYMDWDIPYSDQHENFDPVPMMGTHHVAKLTGDSVSVRLGPSADTSAWVIDSSIASQSWSVTGATLSSSTAVNPIATFTSAGTYLAYCLFTADNGKSFLGVRYVIIWDDIHPLIENFTLSNGQANFEDGYSFDVTLFSSFDAGTIRKRSLVILCTEDFSENTPVTMPGQIEGAENILCVGWISDIKNDRGAFFGEISFSVHGAQYWLKQIRDYPSGLQLIPGTAAAWIDMPSLTPDRACWHFLHWRSTATRVLDFSPTDDTRIASQFNIARANLWERLVQVTTPVIFAGPHVDNFGRLFCFVEPQMVPVGDRSWPVAMELQDDDIEDGISWTRNDVTPLSMLFLSGISVDGSNSANSFFSISPGHSYAHHGEEESQDNYLVADQANSNNLCGLYYGWKNNPLGNVEFKFAHSLRVLGLFPRQYFYYEVSAEDDPRGLGFASRWIPREVHFEINPETGFVAISATMEPESFPGPAVNGDVPTMETVDFSTPTSAFTIPPLPEMPILDLPPGIENLNMPSKIVIASTNFGVLYSENVNNGDVTKIVWKTMNIGLTDMDWVETENIIVAPSGAIFLQTPISVFAAAGLGGMWRKIADISNFNDGKILAIGLNPTKNEEIAIVGSRTVYDGTPAGRLVLASTSGLGAQINSMRLNDGAKASVVFSNNKWHVFGSGNFVFASPIVWHFSAGGALLNGDSGDYIPGSDFSNRYAAAFGTQDKILLWSEGSSGQVATAGATVYTAMTGAPQFRWRQSIAPSPTGSYAIGGVETFAGSQAQLSTDGGQSWAVLSAITFGPNVYENCRDDNRWLFGGGANIRITLDRGTTSDNLMGNLLSFAPLINIVNIRFVE